MRILITGAAGFIGSTTAHVLLDRGDEVVGIDNLNDYYDVTLKEARLQRLQAREGFTFAKVDIADREGFEVVYKTHAPDRIIHLAAQAGVRYSLENPQAYVDANVTGFLNVLEAARHLGTEHLVYASTSSVYGAHENMPFSVHDGVDHPVSLYAATKKANELMAHTYAHLFGIPCTGLRFFTVYGPWGRPDMALFLFTKKILAGEPIDVFNHGHHTRDFTYVDDIVEGIVRACDKVATPSDSWDPKSPDPATSAAPYRLYNIGSNNPVNLSRYIEVLEETLGIPARKNMLPLQPGDVPDTFANVDDLIRDVDYKPDTPIEHGIAEFVKWYKRYYQIDDVAHNVR
jgi:UDP-glucuronate 4-epimerase